VWRNALGWEVVNELPGAYVGNPYPYAVNGSLWTLPIELRLYALLAIAGVIGLLSRRYAWTLTVGALVAVFVVRPEWFPLSPNGSVIRELALLFALGSSPISGERRSPLIGRARRRAGLDRGGTCRHRTRRAVRSAADLCTLTVAYHPALQWCAFNGLGDYLTGSTFIPFRFSKRSLCDAGRVAMLSFAMAMLITLAVAARVARWRSPCSD
jgi:hypothetical protein